MEVRSIKQHPSEEAIGDFVRANMAPGAALAISAHLELCPGCAATAERMEGRAHPSFRPGAGRGLNLFAAPITSAPGDADRRLPPILQRYAAADWRDTGPTARQAKLVGAAGLGEAVYLLEVAADAPMPLSSRSGAEYVLVLDGGFSQSGEHYGVGDFIELARLAAARLVADPLVGCLALVVTAGRPLPARGQAGPRLSARAAARSPLRRVR